ncbi:MAG: PKD domain-containing protein [Chitinophagales bacterium]|nr:PKD domain-containing protein [Chitinophagales bacterium]
MDRCKYILLLLTACWLFTVNAQMQIVQAEYYFDVDPGVGNGSPLVITPGDTVTTVANISVAGLLPGDHIVLVRVKDDQGNWSVVTHQLFYINPLISPVIPPPPPFTLIAAEYFFDKDPGPGNGIPIPFIAGDTIDIMRTLSTTGLSIGEHILGVRIQELSGIWGIPFFTTVDIIDSSGNPIADFTTIPANAGSPTSFINTSTNADPNAVYLWDIDGDGTVDYTSKDPNHTYSQPGIYEVTMNVSNPDAPVDTSGLKALYRIYGGSLVNFASGFSNASKTGDIVEVPGRLGEMGGAYSNDSATAAAYFSSTRSNLTALDSFTLSYWFKGTDHEVAIALSNPSVTQFIASSLSGVHAINSPANGVALGSGITNNNWHHVAVTWKRNTPGGFRSFLDGNLIQFISANNSDLATVQNLIVGGTTGNEARGNWDDIYFFCRDLDTTEIRTLSNEINTSTVIKLVTIGPDPSTAVDVMDTTVICTGDTVVLTAPPGSDHLWSNGTFGQSIIVTSGGTYVCAFLDTNGTSKVSEAVFIKENPTMVISLTVHPETNSNANGSAGITVNGGNGPLYDINWSTGSTDPSIVSLSAGSYFVTVSDKRCPEVLEAIVSNIIVSSGILEAEYFIDTDPGTGNAVPMPITQGDDIASFADVDVTGFPVGDHILSVRVKDDQGNWSVTNSEPFYIFEGTFPVFPVEPAGDVVALEYFFNNIDPGPGNGNPIAGVFPMDTLNINFGIDVSSLPTGFHIVNIRAKDSFGRWSVTKTEKFAIIQAPEPPPPDLPYPLIAAEYFFNDIDPGVGHANLLHIPLDDTIDVNRTIDLSSLAQGSHKISIRVQELPGIWSVTNTMTFSIDSVSCIVPNVDFSNTSVNAGQPMIFTNLSSNIDTGVTYAWDVDANGSNEATTQNFNWTFATPGVYDVKLTVDNGTPCTVSLIKQVTVGPVLPDTITVTGNTILCEGEMVQLTAPNGSDHLWSSGDTNQVIIVSQSGTYQASYNDGNGNPALSNAIFVKVLDTLDVSIVIYPETNGMMNGSAGVTVSGGNSPVYSYLWSTAATLPSVNGLSSGPYSVTVSDGSCPTIIVFNVPSEITSGGIVKAEYFVDDVDPGPGAGVPFLITEGDTVGAFFDIQTAGLSIGKHKLSVRVKEENGSWSVTQSQIWFIIDTTFSEFFEADGEIIAAEYFFDNDPGPGNGFPVIVLPSGDSIDIPVNANTAGLEPGFHKISLRVYDNVRGWSITQTRKIFIDLPPLPPLPDILYPVVAAEYFFDEDDPGPGNAIAIHVPPADTISIPRTIDISTLTVGTHRLSVRVKDLAGNWSVIYSQLFIIDTVSCPVPNVDFNTSGGNAGVPVSFINTSTSVNGSTQYAWDVDADGTVEATTQNLGYTFPSPGTYDIKLTVDNGSPCIVSLIKQVEIGPLLSNQLIVGGGTVLCEGDSITITAPTGSDYLWSNGDTTEQIVVTMQGVYQTTYTDANNNVAISNAVFVKVNDTMTIILTTYDETNSLVNGSAGVSASGGSSPVYFYNWSTGANLPSIVNLAAGSYNVTVSEGVCPEVRTAVINNLAVTSGIIEAEYFIDDTDPGPGNGTPFPITQGDTTGAFINFNTTGLAFGNHRITLRVKDDQGNWSVAQSRLFRIVDTLVVFPEEQIGDIIAAEYFIDDTDPGPGNANPVSGISIGDTIDHNFNVDLGLLGVGPGPHILSVRVLDDLGRWSITGSAPFNNCNPPAAPIAGADVIVCFGDTIQLSASFVPGATYLWTGPNGYSSTDQNPLILNSKTSNSGTYLVRTEGDTGCFSITDDIIVQVDTTPPNPGVITGTGTICFDQDTGNFFVPPIPTALSYGWSLPDGVIILAGNNTNSIAADFTGMIDTTGTVRLTVTNSCGFSKSPPFIVNKSSDTVEAVVTPLGPTTFCSGGSVTLQGNTGPGLTYQWQRDGTDIPGATASNLTASVTGLYTLIVTNTDGCQNNASEAVVAYNNPSVTIYDTVVASTLYAVAEVTDGAAPLSYLWNTGGTDYFIAIPGNETYSVTVTDNNGCTGTATETIYVPGTCNPEETVYNLTTTNITFKKAKLNWDALPGTAKWQLRGRTVGTVPYLVININNAGTTSYNATGLDVAECYEWEIRAICNVAGTISTPFSTPDTFCTDTCHTPDTSATVNITKTKAKLIWSVVPGSLGYRVTGAKVGDPPITFDVTPASNAQLNASGLTPNTTYAWIVQAGCYEGSLFLSDPTPVNMFTTLPAPAPLVNTKSSLTFTEEGGIYVYPNPADDYIYIDLPEKKGVERSKIILRDAQGKELIRTDVVNRQSNVIPVSHFAPGVYTIEWIEGRKTVSVKVVII